MSNNEWFAPENFPNKCRELKEASASSEKWNKIVSYNLKQFVDLFLCIGAIVFILAFVSGRNYSIVFSIFFLCTLSVYLNYLFSTHKIIRESQVQSFKVTKIRKLIDPFSSFYTFENQDNKVTILSYNQYYIGQEVPLYFNAILKKALTVDKAKGIARS